MRLQWLKFSLVSCLAMSVSYEMFVALSLAFPSVTPYAHQLVSIVPTTLMNYFLNSYWTFRDVERCLPSAMQQSSHAMTELAWCSECGEASFTQKT